MDAEIYIIIAIIGVVYMCAKISMTRMKLRYGMYGKGDTDDHSKALARAREGMDPYKGLNKARERMKGSLNAHKEALARAKGKMK